MTVVALFVHPESDAARDTALELIDRLTSQGHGVRLSEPGAQRCDRPDLAFGPDELVDGLDLAVSLGGDGTMLWTIDVVARAGVPVLGVNLGQLGYLTEVEPHAAAAALDKVLAGDHQIEERLLLAGEVWRDGERLVEPRHAVNEIVVEKAPLGQIVRLSVEFDGRPFTTYAADGLIVATPTGSTAYSLSARGPVVAPTHRALLLTPVAPHMLFDRSLVLEAETVVEVEVLDRPALVAADGRPVCELEPGDRVRCAGADLPARLVTFGERDFHEILKSKFGLLDR